MKELDLTKGSVPHVLLRFALPYLLANVLQALYGGADLFVVGRFDDAASVAGVAIGSQVMHTPVEAMADTRHYLLICSIGIPFIIGYNVVFGIMRGLGDSQSPLYFVGIACVLNIVLDFVLVGGLHMRAAGAALATVASQGISFAASLWYLRRKGFQFPFTRRHLRLDGRVCRRIATLGRPLRCKMR